MENKKMERFEKLPDGWIKDNLLGVDWGQSSEKRMNWEDAKKYCTTQGGRLPEVSELQRLVDYSRCNPAIDPVFADIQSDYYWSSTTGASIAAYAWYVHFFSGCVFNFGKTNTYYVRPVRGGQ